MPTRTLQNLTGPVVTDWNAAASEERSIDVAWLLAPEQEPQQNVHLTMAGDRLIDVNPVSSADLTRVLPVAVVPPLVNAHTHLEFSNCTEQLIPATPFPDWIRSVIRWRTQRTETSREAIQRGLEESAACGVSVLGEITTSDDFDDGFNQSWQHVVSFRELLGILPDRIADQVVLMDRHLNRLSSAEEKISPGISPHAPYSVHPDLFAAAVDTCESRDVPLAMHIAETRDELELLDRATGRFADFLRDVSLWDSTVFVPGRTALFYLEQLARVPRSLAIHGNHLTDDEIRFLGRNPNVAVVYCPRTHAYFGHGPHPWRRILAAGGTVVLGTDGRSSNPDLSIWKELQHIGRLTDSPAVSKLLPLITTEALRAIGRLVDRSLLTPNGPCNATFISLPADSDRSLSSLLRPESAPVAVLRSGKLFVVPSGV